MIITPVRVRGWLAALTAALVAGLLPVPAWAIETYYSRGFFPVFQPWVTRVSNLVPLALIDVFIAAAVVLVVWRVARLVRAANQRGVWSAIWEGSRRLIRAVAGLVALFLMMWGFNYRRVPLDQTLPRGGPASVDELRAVVAEANALGAQLRPLGRDEAQSLDDVTRLLPQPLNDALAMIHRPPLRTPGRPKYSRILTPFFTAAGVDGMVNPLALETLVHPDLLPFERPFIVAHEWAHLAGTADEAEASAIGWLACMQGGPALAYSASVYLIVEAAAAMPPGAWREASRGLDPGIRADLAAMAQRQARQQPQVQRAAFKVYDQYLRANRVNDGVASYSRALSLILSPALRGALSAYRVDRSRQP